MSGEMARLEATVKGHVQGVGFRYFVATHAQSLELTGWVANESDGSVRVVAEGRRGDLDSLLELLREGPASASVAHVATDWLPYTGSWTGFGYRYGAHRGD